MRSRRFILDPRSRLLLPEQGIVRAPLTRDARSHFAPRRLLMSAPFQAMVFNISVPLAFITRGSLASASSGTTANCAAFGLSAGQHVFAFAAWDDNDSSTLAATDTAGNTYTALSRVWNSAVGPTGVQWFYSLNVGAGHANNVVTVSNFALNSFAFVGAYVFSGSVPTTINQVTGTNGSATRTVTTSSGLTVPQFGVLLAVGNNYNNSNTDTVTDSAGSTWTVQTDWAFVRSGYVVLSSAGVTTDTVTTGHATTGTLTGRAVAALGINN